MVGGLGPGIPVAPGRWRHRRQGMARGPLRSVSNVIMQTQGLHSPSIMLVPKLTKALVVQDLVPLRR